MGFLDKAKKAAQQAQQALAPQAGQQGDGMVHVQGAGGMINPAVIGGPRFNDGVLIIIVWANAEPGKE